jgi:methylglutaconyl-CoA hydratase
MFHKLEINSLGVATVTLNRPDVHNAFNEELIQRLIDSFIYIERSENVRVVVLAGEGKSFCAGADLHWMGRMKDYSYEENLADSKKLCDLFTLINACPYPVIARVNGHALGGGAGLVACCDYVLAVDSVLMGFTEVKLGLVPAVISPFVIAKIGEGHARATFLNGEKFNMDRALRMGLVHQLTTEADLDRDLGVVIEGFLSAAPKASITAKALIRNVVKLHNISVAREYTCETISKIRTSKEGQEGMSALLEKRKAKWQ